jgi:type VI secretion system protein ImpM
VSDTTVGDSTVGDATAVAGWYGKLAALGDFASRRLPPAFVTWWDEWLQRSIAVSRTQLGDGWLPTYLKSPIWRFALLPSLCGASGWAGIVMPSVDRVGRYFPLTVAVALEPGDTVLARVAGADAWFDVVERLALATLNPSFGATDLDRGLAEQPLAAVDAVAVASGLGPLGLAAWWRSPPEHPFLAELDSTRSLGPTLALAAQAIMGTLGERRSLWWTRDGRAGAAALRCYPGMPPFGDFVHMMNTGR